ncbi:MAG: hypothetical protein WBB85_07830 [Albidovulum sp.]
MEISISRTRRIALPMSLMIWGSYMLLRYPVLKTTPYMDYVPSALPAAVASLAIGYALTLLGAMIWQNRRNLRRVLKPTRARIFGALALGFFTAPGFFGRIPFMFGGFAIMILSDAPHDTGYALIFLIPAALWYPVSGLIVTSIRSKLWRAAIFALMDVAVLATAFLVTGIPQFRP